MKKEDKAWWILPAAIGLLLIFTFMFFVYIIRSSETPPANRDGLVVQWSDDAGFEHLKHSCGPGGHAWHDSSCTLVGQVGNQKYVIPLVCNTTNKSCRLQPGAIRITVGE